MLMTTQAERKEHPISMRLPEAYIAINDRAALCAAAPARTSCATRPSAPPRMCSWRTG